jgi:molybdopterin synthase sulfur carrier subunit
MVVTVKLFATFRKGRFDVAQVEQRPGATLAGLVEELGLPKDEIGIVLVSGRHAELAHQPADGDVVSIFPLVGGG